MRFQVSLQGADSELTKSNGQFERIELGYMDAGDLLEKFQALEKIEYDEDDIFPSEDDYGCPPTLMIETFEFNFVVVSENQTLQLSNPEDPNQSNLKLSPAEAVEWILSNVDAEDISYEERQLEKAKAQMEENKERAQLHQSQFITWGGLTLAICVLTGSVLYLWIFFSKQTPINLPYTYEKIEDPGQRQSMLKKVAGIYATGRKHGDLLIVLKDTGEVEFLTFYHPKPDGEVLHLERQEVWPFDVGYKDKQLIGYVSELEPIYLNKDGTILFYNSLYKRLDVELAQLAKKITMREVAIVE